MRAETDLGADGGARSAFAILALIRDSAAHLPRFESLVTELKRVGDVKRVIVGENGSSDRTRELLEAWAAREEALVVVDTSSMSDIRGRYARMAHGRELLKRSVDADLVHDCFILLVDIDVIDDCVATARALVETARYLARAPSTFAVSAVSSPIYYDVIALRWGDLVSEDIAGEIDRRKTNPVAFQAYMSKVHGIQKAVPLDVDTPCESAFNGMALYKGAAFSSGAYAGESGGVPVCEHVAFHRSLRVNGHGEMLISPRLRVLAPQDHLPRTLLQRVVSRLGRIWRRLPLAAA